MIAFEWPMITMTQMVGDWAVRNNWDWILDVMNRYWYGASLQDTKHPLPPSISSAQACLFALLFVFCFVRFHAEPCSSILACFILHVLPPLKRMWRYLTPAYFSTISKSSAVFYLTKKKLHWNQSKPASEQCNSGQCFILPPGQNSVGGTQYLGSWASTRRREKQCELPTNQEQREDGYFLALILLHAKQIDTIATSRGEGLIT